MPAQHILPCARLLTIFTSLLSRRRGFSCKEPSIRAGIRPSRHFTMNFVPTSSRFSVLFTYTILISPAPTSCCSHNHFASRCLSRPRSRRVSTAVALDASHPMWLLGSRRQDTGFVFALRSGWTSVACPSWHLLSVSRAMRTCRSTQPSVGFLFLLG